MVRGGVEGAHSMNIRPRFPTWRGFRRACALLALALPVCAGCFADPAQPELVWGRRGVQNGDMVRPRAVAIDDQDRLYIVDYTARIQVYDRDGKYLGKTWTTPDYRNGRPSGLSIARDGNLIVSDSHYHCFRIYSPDGQELRRFGGEGGTKPGQLGYVSDVLQDADGFYYVAEFGENGRISKFDADGAFIKCWGEPGTEPCQFARARALALGPKDGLLYVADACNHRIQVFTRDGELVRLWGEIGTGPGQMKYPYDLAFDKAGDLYVVEFGNHRVQKFTALGEPRGCWGGPGREPGRLNAPWGLAIDSWGDIHVLDTDNHRVQRIAPF
jgi:DNA-binding beta-propeller fold protein YncE